MNGWEWTRLPGETNAWLTLTNVDSFVDWTRAAVEVTDAAGETVWLGPAGLMVVPLSTIIPGSGSFGPASRYPLSINVFGQPTNLNNVVVNLWGLSHSRSADLNILLLSPSGKRIILMSNVGGTNGVMNANIAFRQDRSLPASSDPLLPNVSPPVHYVEYQPSNYGQKTPQVPFGLPAGSYSSNLQDLEGDNPNGIWKLYIYDDVSGGSGQLYGSWSLNLVFQ